MGSLLKKLIITLTFVGFSSVLQAEVLPTANQPLTNTPYPKYPITTPAQGKQAEKIQRGEYLAKVGDCISCHTDAAHGGTAYAGGLAIKTPFGTFYTPNITPDKETGIGNWTEQDFIKALKKGRDPKGRNYFPVFPYLYFSKLKEEDASALYDYFMSIPAVSLKNKPLPFPFNVPGIRSTLWGWNLLFFFPEHNEIPYEKQHSPAWNRGKYLVDGLGHCSMCHTPMNAFGAPKTKYYLTGTFINGYWAPNITGLGLESATVEEVAQVFKDNELLHKAGPVAGPMAEVNHNSLNHLSDADRLAIAHYIKSVDTPDPLALSPSQQAPSLSRGKQVYTQVCSLCHQDGKMSAPIIGDAPNWTMRLKDSGLTGLYNHVIYGFNSMPIKGACLSCSDNDLIAAVDYILHKSLTRSQKRSLLKKRDSDVK